MAEYKRFSCPYGDDFEGGEVCDRCDYYEICMETPTADVIERTEYEKLKKENEELKNILADKSVLEEDGYYKTSCNLIKKVFNMDFKMQEIERSKITKAIAEIKELYTEWENSTDDAKLESNPFGAVLNIIQRNIGE